MKSEVGGSMEKSGISSSLRSIFYAVCIMVLLVQIYPVFWVFISSFKTAGDMATKAPYAFPSGFYLGNYTRALLHSRLPTYFFNSVVTAFGTLVGIILLGAPAAYAISKIHFKYNEKLLSFFLFGIMIPSFACLIPMFQIYNVLRLRNTYFSLILPQVGFGLPMCIYLYSGFMRFIPNSLSEAAIIDGASNLQIFLRIIFPMARNSTLTIIIFNFVNIWNEFTYANTFMTKSIMKTLPIGLNDFIGEMGRREWGPTFSAIVIAIAPTLVIYFFLNKYVMAGMAAGALKE
jgi:raffinose/stachyose/melibiose transport system permease protein